MTAKRPAWTRLVSITTCIEGLDLGADGAAVRAELYAKAPDAYTAKTLLWVIWKLLSPESRTAIERAWEVELEGAPLRADRIRRNQGASPTARHAAGGSA